MIPYFYGLVYFQFSSDGLIQTEVDPLFIGMGCLTDEGWIVDLRVSMKKGLEPGEHHGSIKQAKRY